MFHLGPDTGCILSPPTIWQVFLENRVLGSVLDTVDIGVGLVHEPHLECDCSLENSDVWLLWI